MTLPEGLTPASTRWIPTSEATASATRSLSPVSSVTLIPILRRPCTASAASGLTVSASAIAPSDRSVAHHDHRRATPTLPVLEHGRVAHAHLRPAHPDLVPIDHRVDALARQRAEALCDGELESALPRRLHHRNPDRVLGGGLGGGGERE